MNLKSYRLFIGNIPAETTEQELRKEFSSYGNIESLEIKTKTNQLNDSVDTFGFVTLQTEDRIVPQCIKEFQQQKFKGVYLNVSRAKESFLEKLKREREEAEAQKNNASLLDPYKKTGGDNVATETVAPLPTLPTLGKGKESSSSESSESESDEEEAKPPPTAARISRPQESKEQDDLVKKWNQETYIEYGKLKILPVTGQVTEVIDRSKPHQKRSEDKKLGENARIADEKRKQGLSNLKSAYEQQKLAIKSALAGGSQNSKKKITFDDDDNDTAGKKKLSLFDTQEEEDDGFQGNFKLRKQMLGEEGQKLYEMQTSFQADNRFRLDARFLEDADKPTETKSAQAKGKDKERMKQLEILSNVTGKPISSESRVDGKNTLQMQRFDPLQQKESNQSDKPEPKVATAERKKADRREDDFKVSNEKFYKVAENFAISSQHQSQGFSLLSMFGKATKSNENTMEVDSTLADKPLKSDTRFRYESSDSEDEQNRKKQKKKENKKSEADGKAKQQKLHSHQTGPGYYTKQGIWKESFFFLPNDARLDVGREFLGFVPGEDGNVKSAKKAIVGLSQSDLQDVRLLYKKRRYRESRFVQKESKLGLRRLKKKTMAVRSKINKPK
ncbi:probable RNA-binding protein CG14230 [Anopheles marshallii]|uniref:probable RNA-binding protein CG14230 n=1 Tax=Anopheles marshallii TaxID=1521116 RepID=UPI00237BA46F|nr:probable RNA-binding protein CG14230 [Anopheles marshallii]